MSTIIVPNIQCLVRNNHSNNQFSYRLRQKFTRNFSKTFGGGGDNTKTQSVSNIPIINKNRLISGKIQTNNLEENNSFKPNDYRYDRLAETPGQ